MGYLFAGNEAHHMWDYGAQGAKLWTCPKGNPSCKAYYIKLNGPNCCVCDQVDKPKQWDLQKDGLFTHTKFTGFEDTTELNDNPVKGAEHWAESSVLPKVLTVTYDYSSTGRQMVMSSHTALISTLLCNRRAQFFMETSKWPTTLMPTVRSLLCQISALATSSIAAMTKMSSIRNMISTALLSARHRRLRCLSERQPTFWR